MEQPPTYLQVSGLSTSSTTAPLLPPPSFALPYPNASEVPMPKAYEQPPGYQVVNIQPPLVPPPMGVSATGRPLNQVECKVCFVNAATARCDKCMKPLCPLCLATVVGKHRNMHVCEQCRNTIMRRNKIVFAISFGLMALIFCIMLPIIFSRH